MCSKVNFDLSIITISFPFFSNSFIIFFIAFSTLKAPFLGEVIGIPFAPIGFDSKLLTSYFFPLEISINSALGSLLLSKRLIIPLSSKSSPIFASFLEPSVIAFLAGSYSNNFNSSSVLPPVYSPIVLYCINFHFSYQYLNLKYFLYFSLQFDSQHHLFPHHLLYLFHFHLSLLYFLLFLVLFFFLFYFLHYLLLHLLLFYQLFYYFTSFFTSFYYRGSYYSIFYQFSCC